MVSGYDDPGPASWAEQSGIDVIRGEGHIAGPGIVEVEGTPYSGDHIVIATGSDPILPPIPGLSELDGVWTNREVTGLAEVPERLLVLGGGPPTAWSSASVSNPPPRCGGRTASSCSSSPNATRFAATACLSPPAGAPASTTSVSRT
jgi:hypothetical protein